jgi:SAM-dependent methyltransferase
LNNYNTKFFDGLKRTSGLTAEVLVPLLIQWFKPQSVVDVGCGLGHWAARFLENGIKDVHGIDGAWVPTEKLLIPQDQFFTANLANPPSSTRRYDLAICLEVAEHLPPESAGLLVDYLCTLSPVVIFSAAVPGQDGTSHINEQWPDYWIRIFETRGYVVRDVLRPLLFQRAGEDFWYAQNVLIFLPRESDGRLRREIPLNLIDWGGTRVVHPRLLSAALSAQRIYPKTWLKYGVYRLVPDLWQRIFSGRYPETNDERKMKGRIVNI